MLLRAIKDFLLELRYIRKQTIKKIAPFALGSLIIVGPLAYLLITNIVRAEAWWDDEWAYRVRVPVTNNTTAETNVYIAFKSTTTYINTSNTNKFQDDCGDLRFTDNNGLLLKYYVASGCGTASTEVHVFMESFPAGSQYIYYYFGNPAAGDGFQPSGFSPEATNYTIGTFGSEEKGPSPSAYWAFNEGYGDVANDSSPNSNTATLGGTVSNETGVGSSAHTIRQEINITNATPTVNGYPEYGIVKIDPAAYSGTTTFYFEVVAKVTSGSGTASFVYNAGTGSTVSGGTTLTISNITSTTYTVYRSSSFTPTGIQNAYLTTLSGTGISVHAARVVVIQEDAPIEYTQTQIEIGAYDIANGNTVLAPLDYPKYWEFEEDNWNTNLITVRAEVTYQVVGTGTNTVTYSSWQDGGYTWTPNFSGPVTVEAWGAGAGGGIVANQGGGGGGGGAYASSSVNITSGTGYAVYVGAGGLADTAAGGEDSTFATDVVVADGGIGTTNAALGTGGTVANSTGTVRYAGGSGGTGQNTGDTGGGGGGAGGPSGAGNSGTNGNSPTNGVGGNGGQGNAGNGGIGGVGGNGRAGWPGGDNATGGGGGGGGDDGFVGGVGGAPGGGAGGGEVGSTNVGADGQVKISWPQSAMVVLQQDDGNFSGWTTVMTIVGTGTSTSGTHVRSDAFVPIDGRHYRIAAKVDGASVSYRIANAKIIVDSNTSMDVNLTNTTIHTNFYHTQGSDAAPQGITLSSDGSKMYVVGFQTNRVYQYSLSTEWDVSTATYDSRKDLNPIVDTPSDLKFSSDGTKLYILTTQTPKVFQYELSTAWDISTAKYTKASSYLTADATPVGMAFSTDGSKIFIVGNTADRVNQYALSTPWDITSMSASQGNIDINSQDMLPTSLDFSADGTQMYIAGSYSTSVHQYTLSTPWSITSASYTSKSLSVSEDSVPQMAISPNGNRVYVLGTTYDRVRQYSLGTSWDISTGSYDNVLYDINPLADFPKDIAFSTDGTKVYVAAPQDSRIHQYNLETPWVISSATYANKSFVIAPDGSGTSLYFSPDGTKMFILATSGRYVYEYNLSTAWDISTASYSSASFSVNAEDTQPRNISFKTDGTIMYIVGTTNKRVNAYNLSTAWDISTAAYASVFASLSAEDANAQSVTFSNDGTKFYMIATVSGNIYQYDMTSAWDVSTASYSSVNFSVAGQEGTPQSLTFSEDGHNLYIIGISNGNIVQYPLSSAWLLSTARTYSKYKGLTISAQETDPGGIALSSDGTKAYIVGATNDTVYQYTLPIAWDISTASYASKSFSVTSQESTPYGLAFSSDGSKMYVVGTAADTVFQYSLSTPWDVSTAAYATVNLDISAQDSSPMAITFSNSGVKMYIVGAGSDTIKQFSLSTPWDISTALYEDISLSVPTYDGTPSGVQFSPSGDTMFLSGSGNDTVYEFSLSTQWDVSTATYTAQLFGHVNGATTPRNIFVSYTADTIYGIDATTSRIFEYNLDIDRFAITKFETQYLLLNKSDAGTGLQGYLALWKSEEWSGVTNAYYYSHDASNSADSSRLVDITADPDANIDNATVTGINHKIATTEFMMPETDHEIDVEVTNSTGVVAAGRIIVLVTFNELGGGTDPNITPGTATAPDWSEVEYCVMDKCLYFDGSADAAIVSQISNIDPGGQLADGFTITFWIKANSTGEGSSGNVFNKGNDTFVKTISGSTAEKATLQASVKLSSSNATVNVTDGITLSKWHHISLAYSDNSTDEVRVYIDGTLVGESTNGAGAPAVDTNPWLIGGTFTNSFHGFIDEFKIYPYERSADQVKTDAIVGAATKGSSVAFGYEKTLSDGLVGYWKLEETSSPSLSSGGNDFSGTWAGNVFATTGKFGRGNSFDGSGDYILVADNDRLEFSQGTSLTLATWFKASSSAGSVVFLFSKNADSASDMYSLRLDLGCVNFTAKDSSSYGVDGVTSTKCGLRDNIWHHVAATYDPAQNVAKIYIDGVLDKTAKPSTASSDAIGASDDLILGGRTGGTNSFYGIIDEVRIYNRALSDTDVSSLYRFAPAPVVYWDFNEGSGTNTINDVSGNGNAGSMNGSMTEDDWVQGRFGNALAFDGSDDFVNKDSADLEISTSVSIMGWVKISSFNADYRNYIISKGYAESGEGYYIRVWSDGRVQFLTGDNAGSYNDLFPTTPLVTANKWHHIAGIVDTDTNSMYLYLDGVNIGTYQYTSTDLIMSGNDFHVGGMSWNTQHGQNGMTGAIDEVKVYNYARTTQQVVEDMNAGHPAPGSPVGSALSHWKFDERAGSYANDSGTSGNRGTISNAIWTSEGKNGGALFFDGNGDYVTLSAATPLQTASKTISFWAYPETNITSTRAILSGGSANWYVGFSTNNTMIFSHSVGAGTQQVSYSANSSVTLGDWAHYAYTILVSGSNVDVSFYKNGNLLETDSYTTGYSSTYGSTWYIGGYNTSSNMYLGSLDDIKFYNSVLTADQIRADYSGGFAQRLGSTGTSASGQPSNSTVNEYCPPGHDSNCEGPVGEWKLDENDGTIAYDTAGNTSQGTLSGGPLWVPGQEGSALFFDGTDDVVEINSNSRISFAGSVSVCSRVKFKNLAASNIIAAKGSALYNRWDYILFYSSTNGFAFAIHAPGGTGVNSYSEYTSIVTNRWYHLCGVFDDTANTLDIYVDGIKRKSVAATGTRYYGDYDFTFGARGLDGTTTFESHNEEIIDYVRVYNYARTPAQVSWEYNRGEAIGWWKFDECQGTTANDSSGSGNHGTITPGAAPYTSVGTCTGSASSEMWAAGATGKYGASLGFDGANDYLVIPNHSSINNLGKMTLSAWMYLNGFGENNNGRIMDKSDGLGWMLFVDPTNSGNIRFDDYRWQTQAGIWRSSSAVISTGRWIHVAVTYDNSSTANKPTFYINGNLETTDTGFGAQGSGTIYTEADDLIIGNSDTAGARTFNGQIDDVRIYNYILTPQQIKTLNNLGAVRFE